MMPYNLARIAIIAIVTILATLALAVLLRFDLIVSWQTNHSVGELVSSQEIPTTRFEVIFCGTASPQTNSDRGQPCLGIVAGGRFFLFDAGQGTSQRLARFGTPFQNLESIFLTHLHSDHMSGLGETLHSGWLYGRQRLIEVIGPPGTSRVLAGFQEVYALDIDERQRVLGPEYLDARTGMGHARDVQIDGDEAVTVYDKDGVVIKAFRVEHNDWEYAYGYRFEFAGKTVVISGDTHYTPAIGHHARGADVLIHEAMSLRMMSILRNALDSHNAGISEDRLERIASAHTPTEQVAQSAQEAGVSQLVVTHLIPPIPANSFVERFFIQGMDEIFDGTITVARDGMRITLAE